MYLLIHKKCIKIYIIDGDPPRSLMLGVTVILATKDKSPFGGKDIYVPHFLQYPINMRNKLHMYAGRYHEREEESLACMLGFPLLLLGLMGGAITGMATDNSTVVLASIILLLAFLLSGFGWTIVTGLIGPKAPDMLIIRQDDVRWSMLLVAFGDNRELWMRLTGILKNGKYMYDTGLRWFMEHTTPLMHELDNVVSTFMISADPTVDDARIVRTDVERIFAKHDQNALESSTAREAAREIKVACENQLFDFQVQMACADASRHAISTNLLH